MELKWSKVFKKLKAAGLQKVRFGVASTTTTSGKQWSFKLLHIWFDYRTWNVSESEMHSCSKSEVMKK